MPRENSSVPSMGSMIKRARSRGVGGFHVAPAHFFAEDVQGEAAGRHFCAGHFFHAAIRLSYGRAVILSLHAHFDSAKIAHGDDVAISYDGLQQRSVLF